MRRLLVTGSRDWQDYKFIESTMTFYVDLLDLDEMAHGDCPFGADLIANQVGLNLGLEITRYPARWVDWGLKAGARRNTKMVEAGADLCLGFLLPDHKGDFDFDCTDKAQAAGIETLIYRGVR